MTNRRRVPFPVEYFGAPLKFFLRDFEGKSLAFHIFSQDYQDYSGDQDRWYNKSLVEKIRRVNSVLSTSIRVDYLRRFERWQSKVLQRLEEEEIQSSTNISRMVGIRYKEQNEVLNCKASILPQYDTKPETPYMEVKYPDFVVCGLSEYHPTLKNHFARIKKEGGKEFRKLKQTFHLWGCDRLKSFWLDKRFEAFSEDFTVVKFEFHRERKVQTVIGKVAKWSWTHESQVEIPHDSTEMRRVYNDPKTVETILHYIYKKMACDYHRELFITARENWCYDIPLAAASCHPHGRTLCQLFPNIPVLEKLDWHNENRLLFNREAPELLP